MRSFHVPQVNRRNSWMRKYTVAICAHLKVIHDIGMVHTDMANDIMQEGGGCDPSTRAAAELENTELPGKAATHDVLRQLSTDVVKVFRKVIKSLGKKKEGFLRCDSSGEYPKIQDLRLKMLEATRSICKERTGQLWTDKVLWKLVYVALRNCALIKESPLTLPAYVCLLLFSIWQENDRHDAQFLSEVVKEVRRLGTNSMGALEKPLVDTLLLTETKIRYSVVHLDGFCSGHHSIFLVPCEIAGKNVFLVGNLEPDAFEAWDKGSLIFVRGFLPFTVRYDSETMLCDSPTGTKCIKLTTEQSETLFDAIVEHGSQDFPPEYITKEGRCELFSDCKNNVPSHESSTSSASELN